MAMALSVDLRIRVLAAVAGGMTHRAAAARFGASAASVSRWRALKRSQGDVRPGRIEAQRRLVLSLLEETPGIANRELCAALGERGRGFSFSSAQRFLKRHGLTRKKDRSCGGAGEAGLHEQAP